MPNDSDFDMILCVCCEEAVAVTSGLGIGGPVCGECSQHARNAADALQTTPGIGICAEVQKNSRGAMPS
jgi:hypothetical protein